MGREAEHIQQNCLIRKWIIQKSRLSVKLTKVKLTLQQTMKSQRGSREY